MSTLEEKFEAIDDRFKNPSKARDAARWIVQRNNKITSDERKALIETIPIKRKTLEGVLTELRKLNIYPPQKTVEEPKRTPALEKPEEPAHHADETPPPASQEYATREDFETLRNSINYLASVISGEAPSNPGELESIIRGETLSNPGETEEEKEIQVLGPVDLFIQDGSVKRESIWIKAKTLLLYDSTKDGLFGDYPGTRGTNPFNRWKKDKEGKIKITWSDFFNIIADEFYAQLYNVDIELTQRRRL